MTCLLSSSRRHSKGASGSSGQLRARELRPWELRRAEDATVGEEGVQGVRTFLCPSRGTGSLAEPRSRGAYPGCWWVWPRRVWGGPGLEGGGRKWPEGGGRPDWRAATLSGEGREDTGKG